MSTSRVMIDGNEAAASVAYRLSEVASIYPITPASAMGELADEWASHGRPNIWGTVPTVVEMQAEGGAIATVHGALQAGALSTTFTASQGLLLMIPNLYKIAGELTACCLHVAARTVATHALSIFGDHSDVYACRQTGFGMLSSGSPQEAHDLACIGHAATLRSRVPFIHFFDGFRTSHEINGVEMLTDVELHEMIDDADVAAHRARALTPDQPVLRGTAQDTDTFFQAREACNSFYDACPGVVEQTMEKFAELTGRRYHLFDYYGHEAAERVVVLMGSGVSTVREAVDHLMAAGERVGVVAVRLYRPFSAAHLLAALPRTVRSIAVLDRTKEPGATAEPLHLDVVASLDGAALDGTLPFDERPRVIGGRYALASKEFTPAMAVAVFAELGREQPRRQFTVGIVDDVTRLSLDFDAEFDIEPDDVIRTVFYGLGSDGTVGANKNTIKILGEIPDHFAQAYFVYDSKKSGSRTVSHLRFGTRPINATYLIRRAQFVGCHQFQFLEDEAVLEHAAEGATLLLNAPYPAEEVWDRIPREAQAKIIARKLRVFTIDAGTVARDAGLGGRINTVMQTCFFALADVLPRDEAIARIKAAIEKTYGRRGEAVVQRNLTAVDASLDHMHELTVPAAAEGAVHRPPHVPDSAPDFVKRVTALMMAGHGNRLPVSAFPVDGTWPVGTGRWEKRSIAHEIPIWDEGICIQCNKCALICPHAAIRAKLVEPGGGNGAPEGFCTSAYKAKDFAGMQYVLQVAPDDCTGCGLCVNVCPAKDKANPRRKAINMEAKTPLLDRERAKYDHFLDLPEIDRTRITRIDVKGSQFLLPLFEYSGTCAGCGETPYVKLLSQLYGDRMLIANATGCSSIYGGNLPTTPYATNADGRGPAWSNSLFEDNAEFGLGFRLAVEAQRDQAESLLREFAPQIGDRLVDELLGAEQRTEAGVQQQRERVVALRQTLAGLDGETARRLHLLADALVRKSVWLVGGDGWAFDIGYGGLDHVLSMQHDVNVLVLDTEVYSNTGGQASKATPIGAAAKFAARGKAVDKKDLGLMAINYGHVYVASVAMGAKDVHTVKAFLEADAYDGPSLIIAYSHCIAHGYDMTYGADQQQRAVASGIWPLYRYDPRRIENGEAALVIDAPGGKIPVNEYMKNEARFRMVEKLDPERFHRFANQAQQYAERRLAVYRHLAALRLPGASPAGNGTPAPAGTEAPSIATEGAAR